MQYEKKAFGRRTLTLSVIIIGWAFCSYLVFRYSQLKNHTASTSDLCKTLFGTSCDQTLSSRVAWHLGYPLAFWGFAYFGLLGVLFSFGSRAIDRIVILLAAFGVGVSAILSVIIIRGHLFCPLCLSIHFINLLVLVALFWGFPSSITISQEKPTFIRSPYVKWAALLLLALGTGGFSEFNILKTFVPKAASVNINDVTKKFEGEKAYNIPKSASSPHIGSPNASVQLVVFSSFQCPACKGFAPSSEALYKKFGNNIGITFKNFPLSTTCNPLLSQNMQPQSCDAALAALAAHRQNRFWNYHDRLFVSDLSGNEKTLKAIAKSMGLNMEKWEQDRHSDEVKKQLSEDVNAGYLTKINATPSVFINGRKVSNLSEQVLNLLIQNELEKNSR